MVVAMTMEPVRDIADVAIGDKLYLPEEFGRGLIHVRGLVDDVLVCREWYRRKRRWCYFCVSGLELSFGRYHRKPRGEK